MRENVANNVAQGNSQDLTEQWRKGELDGAYYIKNSVDEYEVRIFYDKKKDYRFIGSSIKEFICKVPSYEEWQELVQDYSEKHDSYLRLSQTNHQLRKFLEEFNTLEVAEENEALKTKLSIQCKANEELRKENQQLKDVISKMCMELVDPDDNMSNGLAEWFNQDLLLEIREVLK